MSSIVDDGVEARPKYHLMRRARPVCDMPSLKARAVPQKGGVAARLQRVGGRQSGRGVAGAELPRHPRGYKMSALCRHTLAATMSFL